MGWALAIVLLLVLLLARLLAAGRQIDETRSVLLRLPCDRAWEAVCHFPALHAAHARGRPHLIVTESLLRAGSGTEPGSVWRQKGRWRGGSYWADLEVTAWDPPRRLSIRLVRDSRSTERKLTGHRGELTLTPEGPAVTKLTWTLSARIGSVRLLLERLLWPELVQARLFDLGLRSVKRALDALTRLEESHAPVPESHGPEPQERPSALRSTGRLQDQV